MNNEAFAQTIRDLPRVWQTLGRTRQMILGGMAAALVIAVAGAVLYVQRPQAVPLYTNLSEQDASAIVAKLKDLKVSYAIADGGSTIRVPQDAAADLRLQLAGQGLPSGTGVGMVGMEVFDRTSLGITDFAQKLNYQRGLEGELTRTIRRLSAVEDARVHLVLPQERLFTSQQKEPSASVMIKQRAGARLADDQVSSIKFLVSKSVEGLKPENVAVVDFNGNTLGRLDSPEQARDKQALTRSEMQRQRETEMEKKIQGLLDQVLGPNHAVVRASIALDWDEVEQRTETYSPGNTQPQTRSQKDLRENFTGQGVDIAPPVGVPGTQANIPSYQASQAGQNSNYQRSDVTTNYEVSSDKRQIVRAPGDVRNLGIAVMIDQTVQAQVDQITQVVTAAAGIQPQRGDQVSVVSLPFDNSLAAQLKKQQDEQRLMEWYQLGAKILGVALAFGGIFFLFRYLVGTVKPKEQPALPGAEPVALPGGTAALLPDSLVQAQLAEAMHALAPPSTLVDREALAAQIRRELEAEFRAQYGGRDTAARREVEQAEREQQEQERIEQERIERERQEAELARRQQMRESVVQLAMEKPDVLAEVLASWLDQGYATATSGRA
ncbi:MAG: flagellar M-ring protein FliF [Chloroflexi bacterium]|nr:flagellar M-ring protein FliF [Chloroflexota bacterium]